MHPEKGPTIIKPAPFLALYLPYGVLVQKFSPAVAVGIVDLETGLKTDDLQGRESLYI